MARGHAVDTLISHLTSAQSLDYLIGQGFMTEEKREVIPSETARAVTGWAIEYFFGNRREVPPSKEAILETWGEEMEKHELVVNDEFENDSIEWAVERLRDQHLEWQTGELIKGLAMDVRKAEPGQKLTALQEGMWGLYKLGRVSSSQRHQANAPVLYDAAMDRYFDRAINGNVNAGLRFNDELDPINDHFLGVHPGEMCTLVAGTGVGKSWMAADTTLAEWKRGRKAVLWTLENDTNMTGDRLICMHAKVPYGKWQEASCSDEEIKRIDLAQQEVHDKPNPFEVIMPAEGERSAMQLIRNSLILGADSMILDQLTFVEHTNRRDPLWAQYGQTMRELHSGIQQPGEELSLLLLHQVNREGMAHARKTGRYEVDHMAGGGEIERTTDFLVALYQSPDDAIVHQARWQTLKARRVVPKDWELSFNPGIGDIRCRGEVAA